MITSFVFWLVLILGAVIYWQLPRGRNAFLFASSGAYIAYLDPQGAAFLLAFSLLAYFTTQTLKHKHKWLTLIVGLGIAGYLGYYKYLPPLLPYVGHYIGHEEDPKVKILVPLGASYFTFKLIHYLIECHRKHIPSHDLASFLAYMFFAPMFTAGPIERFEEFLKNRSPTFSRDYIYRGGTRIIYGFIKKFVIVDLFVGKEVKHRSILLQAIPLIHGACPTDQLLADLNRLHPFFVWQYVINHYVASYLDFRPTPTSRSASVSSTASS